MHERAFVPGLILMACAVGVALVLAALNSELVHSFPLLYLLPWVLGLAALFTIPSAYLFYKGRLRFYDPLVFTTWVWFFPGFVLGGIMLTGGWSQPYFLSFIQDAEYNLPYTVFLIMLGFIGLAAMIFGRWHPVGALMAALVFGFADSLQQKLAILQTPIPSEFLAMAPYIATIVLVAGIIGKARPPAADGKPYIRE